MIVVSAAAQAESICPPYLARYREKVRLQIREGAVIPWYESFTRNILDETRKSYLAHRKELDSCIASDQENRRCFACGPESLTLGHEPEWDGANRTNLTRRGYIIRHDPHAVALVLDVTLKPTQKQLFRSWTDYTKLLESAVDVFSGALNLYPGLKDAIEAELTFLRSKETQRSSACQAALQGESGLSETSGSEETENRCTDVFLSAASFSDLRAKVQQRIAEQQEAHAQKERRMEVKAATEARSRRERRETAECQVVAASRKYCELMRAHTQIENKIEYQNKLDEESGTVVPAQKRKLTERSLEIESLMDAQEEKIRALGGQPPDSCSPPPSALGCD
jgi:hypothetical protein